MRAGGGTPLCVSDGIVNVAAVGLRGEIVGWSVGSDMFDLRGTEMFLDEATEVDEDVC